MALDFFDFQDSFRTVEEVLVGRMVFTIPVALPSGATNGGANAFACCGWHRLPSGRAGARVRERLQAVLPFTSADDGSFEIRARVMANPAAEPAPLLEGFAPMPRLVVVEESETEKTMQYVDSHGAISDRASVDSWCHVP